MGRLCPAAANPATQPRSYTSLAERPGGVGHATVATSHQPRRLIAFTLPPRTAYADGG